MFVELAEWLHTAEADVFCFQEVTRTPGLEGWTRFDDPDRSLPQRANLFDDLRAALPGYTAYFHASDAGPVACSAGSVHRQDFGLATFVAERLTVIAEAARFVHGEFATYEAWPAEGRPRVAHAIRVLDPGGRPVTLAHLHGLRDAAGKADSPERSAQARRLARFVAETRRSGDTTVVCGDFNLLPDSETFTVLADIGLVDLVGDADTRTSRYRKPIRHADYMLVSDPGRVVAFEVLAAPEVSDHRILRLEL